MTSEKETHLPWVLTLRGQKDWSNASVLLQRGAWADTTAPGRGAAQASESAELKIWEARRKPTPGLFKEPRSLLFTQERILQPRVIPATWRSLQRPVIFTGLDICDIYKLSSLHTKWFLLRPTHVPVLLKPSSFILCNLVLKYKFFKLLQNLLYLSLFPVHSLLIQQQFTEFSVGVLRSREVHSKGSEKWSEKATNRVGADIFQMSGKGFMSKIYKEFLQLMSENINE